MSAGTAAERVLGALRDRGRPVRPDGADRWRSSCPAHDGRDLNLSVAVGDQGVLVRCHSHDCTAEDIARSLGLRLSDLFDRDGRATYGYPGGHVVTRTRTSGDGKQVRQMNAPKSLAPTGLWTPTGTTPIAEAATVLLAEGEKAADALVRLGAPCAATWPGGTGGVGRVDLEPLRGRHVAIVPDNDEPGQKAAQRLVERLNGVAESIHLWRVPESVTVDGEARDGLNDAADLWVAGGSLDDLQPVDLPSPPPMPDANVEPTPDAFEAAVAAEAGRIRVRDAARAVVAAESAETVTITTPIRLDAFLASHDAAPEYRIDGLLPSGGKTLLAAPAKAGKSTTVGNLVRAVADGDEFLGRATKRGKVVLVDDELDERTLRRWLGEQGIARTENVMVVPIRGKVGTFNLIDEHIRSQWADVIRGADLLIVDCLRPILDALGLSEHTEAGRFLVALDALQAEAGVGEQLLVHHMGHGQDRARGDSRLLDWPDALWRITCERPEDPDAPRLFSAYGRDVHMPDTEIRMSPDSRRLSAAGQSARSAKLAAAAGAIVDLLRLPALRGGLTKNQIEKRMAGIFPRAEVREAFKTLATDGRIVTAEGPNGAQVFRVGDLAADTGNSDLAGAFRRGTSPDISANSIPVIERNTGNLANLAEPRRRTETSSSPPLYKGGELARSAKGQESTPEVAGLDPGCCRHGVTLGARCSHCGGRAVRTLSALRERSGSMRSADSSSRPKN